MASFWGSLSQFFKSSSSGEPNYYEDPETKSLQEVASISEAGASVQANEEEAKPQIPLKEADSAMFLSWLEDEEALRDEGVLFGLSESDSSEKTDIIWSYFAHQAADFEGEIERQNERVQELNLFLGQKENRIDELKQKLRQLEERSGLAEHNLPRTLVGLLLSIAMCVGNYFLIEETLSESFTSSSYVAIGVFLAGMFNLFGGVSLFHDKDSNVSWRSLLEEVGMPFAASLFVFAQAWQSQPWWRAVSLLVFVFFLFLFAGKLLLGNLSLLRSELRVWLRARSGQLESVVNADKWDAEIVRLRGEIDELRVRKWQVLKEQSEAEMQRGRIYARRDMLVKLFESEFSLARRMKGKFSERQLKEIKNQ